MRLPGLWDDWSTECGSPMACYTVAPEASLDNTADNPADNPAEDLDDGLSEELRRISNLIDIDSPKQASTPSSIPQANDILTSFVLPPSALYCSPATSASTIPPTLPSPVGSMCASLTLTKSNGPLPYKAKVRKVAQLIEVDAGVCDVSAEGVTKQPHFICRNPPIDANRIDREMRECDDIKKKKAASDLRQRLINTNNRIRRRERDEPVAYVSPRFKKHQFMTDEEAWDKVLEPAWKKWAHLRDSQVRDMSKKLNKDSNAHGFLTNDMQETVVILAEMASRQAVIEARAGRVLPTASSPFWTLALAQEAWRRCVLREGDWSTDRRDIAEQLSWEGVQKIYYWHLKGNFTDEEPDRNLSASGMLRGNIPKVKVGRKICSHSLGTREDSIKKMDCLHRLLVAAGDKFGGLHADIRGLRAPLVIRYPNMETSLMSRKERCIASHSTFGTKKPTEMEKKDLAAAAASIASTAYAKCD